MADRLATTLARLVAQSFSRAGVTQEKVLGGGFDHTNLPWQIPPLQAEATLFDVPFSEYTASVTYLQADALVTLWSDALSLMLNSPNKVLSMSGFRAASYALNHVYGAERNIHLSIPDGYPGGVGPLAGITLSLEVAHLMRGNTKLTEFVSDDDNYYAVLPTGETVGVRNGLPSLYAEVWDTSVVGMVQEMLQTPRGAVWEGCDYDIISKVRSVLYTTKDAFIEFDGVDWALQTLRCVGGDKELLRQIKSLPKIDYERANRTKLLGQARNALDQLSTSDRQKIETLKQLLVPEVMTSSQFSKRIYPFHALPAAVVADKVMARIHESLDRLFEDNARRFSGRKGTI